MRRQSMEWEKIFANHTYDKEQMSKTYKNTYNQREKKAFSLKNGQGY